jgi:hypothetical protein
MVALARGKQGCHDLLRIMKQGTLDPVTSLIGHLFVSIKEDTPADARDVAKRAAKKLKRWPNTRARALEIAAINNADSASLSDISDLAYLLRSEFRKAAKSDDYSRHPKLPDYRLYEALWLGAISKKPSRGGWRKTCSFCWRPGVRGRIGGERAYLCEDHHANRPAGRRLIRMAQQAGGWDALRKELGSEIDAVKSDYAALAAANKRHSNDPMWKTTWKRFHEVRGEDPEWDDFLSILAAAWDQVEERYRQLLSKRPTAGGPRKWTDDEIASAAKERGNNLSLRDLSQATGISTATLSRRLPR